MNSKSRRFRLRPIYYGLLFITLVPNCFAAQNFQIQPNGPLPTKVGAGSAVDANFTLTNLTSSARKDYVIRGLPKTVKQITSAGNCSTPINLAAHASCNLKFNITGAVDSYFAICKGNSCTTSSVPLKVTLADDDNILAAGNYNDGDFNFHPMMLQNKNGTLNYPATILTNLPIDPAYVTPNLYSVSCKGNTCVSVGHDETCSANPLAALSLDGGDTWTYPIGSMGSWPDGYDVFTPATLSSASCSSSLCAAGGNYQYNNSGLPVAFLAQYKAGQWSFPIDWQNQPTGTQVNNNLYATFNNVSCYGTSCIAVGTYTDSSSDIWLLLAETTNGGSTWSYKIDHTLSTLPSNYMSRGEFFGASCFNHICIAGGTYEDNDTSSSFVQNPLLAQSIDGGTWEYAIAYQVGPQLSAPLQAGGYTRFNSTSCSDTICIAAGAYTTVAGQQYALLAQSTNTGATWSYAIATPQQQPSDYLELAQFTSASCDGSVCIAAGYYTNQNAKIVPLIAQTTNAGSTWTYAIGPGPNALLPPNYTSNGKFYTASCNSNVCVAAGNYMFDQPTFPMLAQSVNGGPWSYIVYNNATTLPTGYNNYGAFNGSNIGTPSLRVCLAKYTPKKVYLLSKKE